MTAKHDETIGSIDPVGQALRQCAAGEKSGLRLIFEAEGGKLLAVAQRILKRRDLAEEALQDGMIQIWRKAGQWSPDRGSARGWVFAVVRNRALNMLRDGSRETLPGDEALAAMQTTTDEDAAAASWSALQSESRLRACLGQLDDNKRNSLLLAYVSGYTHGEIAGRLRIPLGTAKAWVRRGLQSLRECMA